MKKTLMIAAALSCLLAGGVEARDLPAGGLTINEVVSWLQGSGYRAEIQTEKDGGQNVYSGVDGNNFHIAFYDCKSGRCGSIQFYVGFDTNGAFTTDKINQWNKENRWTKAYVDPSNDPWLEYDIDLTPGGTYELLNDEFAIWRGSLSNFHKFGEL
jgi:hypothetical protein